MNDQVSNYLLSIGYKSKAAEAGIEGLLRGWRGAVRGISNTNTTWIIYDFWYALVKRAVLDEVLPLVSEAERATMKDELTKLDQEFKKCTWPTLHNLNKASRARGENVWRDYRLPKNIKLNDYLQAFIQEAKDRGIEESD